MKELDLLLEQFVHNHRKDLENGYRPEFEELLRLEDDILWDYLQNPDRHAATRYRSLLDEIRGSEA